MSNILVLAHESGWDEALLVLIPVVALFLLLVFANRRAKAVDTDQDDQSDAPTA